MKIQCGINVQYADNLSLINQLFLEMIQQCQLQIHIQETTQDSGLRHFPQTKLTYTGS